MKYIKRNIFLWAFKTGSFFKFFWFRFPEHGCFILDIQFVVDWVKDTQNIKNSIEINLKKNMNNSKISYVSVWMNSTRNKLNKILFRRMKVEIIK